MTQADKVTITITRWEAEVLEGLLWSLGLRQGDEQHSEAERLGNVAELRSILHAISRSMEDQV